MLTSRLTQDCLENLFSTIRHGNSFPTPLAFKRALKTVTVAQYLKSSREGSYNNDDSQYLASYLHRLADGNEDPENKEADHVVAQVDSRDVEVDEADSNVIYYPAGKGMYYNLGRAMNMKDNVFLPSRMGVERT